MIANGIVEAVKELDFKLPLVVRFQGTNAKEGKDVINNSDLGLISIDDFTEAAKKVVGDKAGLPYLSMGGEDFSYYLQKRPGCFFFVGSAPDPTKLFGTPQHCSHYDIDEKSLSIGPSVFLNLVDDILGN